MPALNSFAPENRFKNIQLLFSWDYLSLPFFFVLPPSSLIQYSRISVWQSSLKSLTKVEELECLATWKEGSSRYLLGLIQYRHPASYEDRFRCFVYEKIKKERGFAGGLLSPLPNHHTSNNNTDVLFRVSQSGDATCNGLSPHEGSRVLTLRRAPVPKTCQFPSWLQTHKQWHSLDERTTFYFENNELRVSNVTEVGGVSTNLLSMTAVCSQIQENPTLDKVLLVLHTTSQCRSGFICTAIYRREGHIIELQIGSLARRIEDSCTAGHFDPQHQPFITLVSSSPETRQCPNLGQFQVTGLVRNGRRLGEKCSQEFNSLSVGCHTLDTLQFRSECSNTDRIAEYSCHGWWEEMGVSYLITSPLSGSRRFCFIFRENPQSKELGQSEKYRQSPNHFFEDATFSSESPESSDFGRVIMFSSMADSCHRNLRLGVEGSFAFNVTSQGRCNGVNSAISIKSEQAIVILITLFLQLFL
ncbi:unnamed protein product [Allacma fusca]|uniref:Uncharacterized protein n=1 Tax=Allacma fusca TaxID=39272 RepID=A0A8J2L1D3_9HEXA|nr:unnamed protein product [Allacma fusca]